MTTKEIIFEGRVQGVGFRYTTKEIALGFDVCGTVRNLPDGTVSMHIQGEDEEVQEYLHEILEESTVAHHIQNHTIRDLPALKNPKGFQIVA